MLIDLREIGWRRTHTLRFGVTCGVFIPSGEVPPSETHSSRRHLSRHLSHDQVYPTRSGSSLNCTVGKNGLQRDVHHNSPEHTGDMMQRILSTRVSCTTISFKYILGPRLPLDSRCLDGAQAVPHRSSPSHITKWIGGRQSPIRYFPYGFTHRRSKTSRFHADRAGNDSTESRLRPCFRAGWIRTPGDAGIGRRGT